MKNKLKNLIILTLLFGLQNISQSQLMNNGEKYERSSLYTLMLTRAGRDYEEDIVSYFKQQYLSEKYNNHNLDIRTIDGSLYASKADELQNAVNFLDNNKIANKLVAKWFNRKPNGTFDLNLIKERSLYNAQFDEIMKAKQSLRGIERISDLGTNLIDNTFILILDSRYTNKEKVASAVSSGLNTLLAFGGLGSTADTILSLTDLSVNTFGKGFIVSTNAHLFKLVWDAEAETRFYNELWATGKDMTAAKKAAFDNADFFYLDYIGTDRSFADVQSTSLTKKTNGELIGTATIRSIDNVMAKLQANYDIFKTKTPVYSVEPFTCKIGLKEGLTKKTKFEILEKVIQADNTVSYMRVATAKIDARFPIWDNTFAANEENPNQAVDATHLKLTSGKNIQPGMLIRQIK